MRLRSDLAPLEYERTGEDWTLDVGAAPVAPARVRARGRARRRRQRVGPRPRQPEARAGRVRREVGAAAATATSRRRGSTRPRRRGRRATSSTAPRARARRGRRRAGLEPGRRRDRRRRCRCWSPTTGPSTTRWRGSRASAPAKIAGGALPPHRVALLAPGERDEWYSASPLYARVLVQRRAAGAARRGRACAAPPAAMGASLGALAMLHAQRRYPRRVRRRCSCSPAASSCPRYDAQERGFSRYARIIALRRARRSRRPRARDAGPDRAHLRRRGGERPQQSRDGAALRPRHAARGGRHCTTTPAGATRSTRT